MTNLKCILFVFLLIISNTYAEELNVSKIVPSGDISFQIKKLYIHFDKDVAVLGNYDRDLSEYINVSTDNKCKTRFISPKILECKFDKKLDYGEVTIEIEDGIKAVNGDSLEDDIEFTINMVKSNPHERKVYSSYRKKQREERFMFSHINCGRNSKSLAGYYYEDNVDLPETIRIDCTIGSTLNLSVRDYIHDKAKIKSFIKIENETHKFINDRLKEDGSYDGRLSFELPEKEGEISFEFTDEVIGQGSRSREDRKKKADESSILSGTRKFIVNILPKKPEFRFKTDKGILEKNGPWWAYYESLNIEDLSFSAKYADNLKSLMNGELKAIDDIENPIKFTRNQAERYYFDLEKKLKLNKKKSYQLTLVAKDPIVGKDFNDAYLNYIQNSYYRNNQEIRGYHFNKSTELQITNLGMHVKSGYFNLLVWVFSLDKGLPQKDANVYFYTKGNEVIKQKTNSDGYVVLENYNEIKDVKRIYVEKGNDFSFIDIDNKYDWNKGIRPWEFNIPYRRLNSSINFLAQTIFDRPIYRPGETVQGKVFTRMWDNKNLTFIDNFSRVSIRIKDSRGKEVLNEDLILNDYGTGVFDFDLPVDAKTGEYSTYVYNANKIVTTFTFKVEEFRLSTIKVSASTNKDEKENINLLGKAEYHFGGAVKEAEGKILVTYTGMSFVPKDKELYKYFNIWSTRRRHTGSHLIYKEDIVFDDKGEIRKTFDKSFFSNKGLGILSFEVSTNDSHGALVANRSSIKVGGDQLFAGIKSNRWSYPENSTLNTSAVLLNGLGDKKNIGKEARIKLFKSEYITHRRKGVGNYYHYDYKRVEKLVDSCIFKFNSINSTCDLKLKDSGSYFYRLEPIDRGDFDAVTRSIYVYGGHGYSSNRHYNHSRIDLITDKQKYEIGDVAKLLIQSPYDNAQALLTIERDGVIDQKRIKLKGSVAQIDLPIDKDIYAPGVFVSVVLVKGRTSTKVEGDLDLGKPSFKIGYAKIEVDSNNTKLVIKPKVLKKSYQPRETVELTISTSNANNQAVQSELAVAVVDEAILQLISGYVSSYKIHNTFYKLDKLGVSNYQSLINLIGRQSFGKKGANSGGGGSSSTSVDDKMLRKDFKAVAYWNPQVQTDKNGIANLKFKAPDNLTGWKVIVVGIDKKQRFGYSETSFKVNKKLMVEPVLPNFLTEFDSFDARFKIHNRTKNALDTIIGIESDHFNIVKKSHKVKIPTNDSREISTMVNSKYPNNYVIRAKAQSGKYRDYVESTIPVVKIASNNTQVVAGYLNGEKVNQSLVIPQKIREDSHSVNITYSTSLLNNLSESFEYVLTYPYGCWEQRMSKVVFWAIYSGFKEYIDVNFKDQKETSPDVIVPKFISMAPDYQNEDGGMKYYPSEHGYSSPYLSIFTAEVFQIMEDFGYEPPSEVKENLIMYLEGLINKDSSFPSYYRLRDRYNDKAKILYVLNKWKPEKYSTEVFSFLNEDINGLSGSALSYYLRILTDRVDKKDKKKEVITNINNSLSRTSSYVSYIKDDEYSKYRLGSQTRTQCQMFTAMTMSNSFKAGDLDLMMEGVLRKRKNNHWYNTQENMYCLYGIYLHMKTGGSSKDTTVVTTKLDNKVVNKSNVASKLKKPISFDIDKKEIKLGKLQKVSIEPSNKKRIYYRMKVEYTDMELTNKSIDKGFSIKKYMYLLDQKLGTWESLDDSILKVKRGDIIKVVLVVETDQERYQVGINDPLAGAFEPINFNLDSTSVLAKVIDKPISDKRYSVSNHYYGDYFRGSGFHYVDLRLKAAQFYADKLLPNRQYHAEYAVTVTSSGRFYLDGTRVEEMYYPDVYGLTPSRRVMVSK